MLKYKDIKPETIEDVLNDVTVTGEGCYLYPYIMNSGYPQYQKNGKHILVHRMMKVFDNEEDLDDGLVVHHTCGNTNCVNPSHLKVMTPKEHSKLHNTRLTKEDIFLILAKFNNDDLTLVELSEVLRDLGINVHYSYISQLVNGNVRKKEVNDFYNRFN